jgi:hypothetical protein
MSSLLANNEDKNTMTFVSVNALKDSRSAVITIKALDATSALIKLYNEDGTIIYKETAHVSGISKRRLDFTDVQDGNYVLEVTIAGKLHRTNLSIAKNVLTVAGQAKETHNLFTFDNEQLAFNILSVLTDTIKVVVTDAKGVVVLEENVTGKPSFEKSYNLKGLEKGSYRVDVIMGDKMQVDFINLN